MDVCERCIVDTADAIRDLPDDDKEEVREMIELMKDYNRNWEQDLEDQKMARLQAERDKEMNSHSLN